jgi:hypothetical protein
LALSGAIFSEVGVPDYSESPAATCRRLEKAFFNVEMIWDAERLRLGLSKKPREQREMKFRFLRTHYPPTAGVPIGLESTASCSNPSDVASSYPLTMLDAFPHTEKQTSSDTTSDSPSSDTTIAETSGEKALPTPSHNGENTPLPEPPPTDPEPREDTGNPGYPKREWTIHPDNSIAIEPTDLTLGLTLEEVMIAARWALLNANHVACRRLKMRDAPTQIAWVFVNWLLDKPGEFMRNVMEKFADIEKAKSASVERIRLAEIAAEERRVEKQRARMDDNRDLRDVSARVASAAQRSARRLQSTGAEGVGGKS